mmetsp:Transcript_34804/g.96030  ORF Transcript_34804/g.96030 Transcript_34804/m.96030 type:complete len:221 (+) Transcript_34804:406-1068(+)
MARRLAPVRRWRTRRLKTLAERAARGWRRHFGTPEVHPRTRRLAILAWPAHATLVVGGLRRRRQMLRETSPCSTFIPRGPLSSPHFRRRFLAALPARRNFGRRRREVSIQSCCGSMAHRGGEALLQPPFLGVARKPAEQTGRLWIAGSNAGGLRAEHGRLALGNGCRGLQAERAHQEAESATSVGSGRRAPVSERFRLQSLGGRVRDERSRPRAPRCYKA